MCLVAAESCNGTHDFGFVRKLFSHHVTVTFDATVKNMCLIKWPVRVCIHKSLLSCFEMIRLLLCEVLKLCPLTWF